MFQNFTNLEILSLASAKISSVLPTSLNISSSLKLLNLAETRLQGKLPHYIFNLPSLKTLDLGNNYFTGDIPSEISLPKLLNLNIGFSGLRMEPHTFHSLLKNSTLLKSLDLSRCSLMGSLPDYLFNLRHLRYLYLLDNKLNGTLPSQLFTLPTLVGVYLDDNMFSGNVPFESFSLPSLETLYLSNNQLVGGLASCKLKGFPNSVRTMKQLYHLDLSGNEIRGQIPHWAGKIGGRGVRGGLRPFELCRCILASSF
ncbi:leucine-rich repeat protein [Artemisia annua]|uniref:Leucine-rich repeat protein n=1 Tax=Artemisia annua TaxID=35608 RepID=A0A2U1M6U4_ARTAN|nr:leucine-rich repeat protein [Artemisia annua]